MTIPEDNAAVWAEAAFTDFVDLAISGKTIISSYTCKMNREGGQEQRSF